MQLRLHSNCIKSTDELGFLARNFENSAKKCLNTIPYTYFEVLDKTTLNAEEQTIFKLSIDELPSIERDETKQVLRDKTSPSGQKSCRFFLEI